MVWRSGSGIKKYAHVADAWRPTNDRAESMTDPGWVVTPKPEPPELTDNFTAEPFTGRIEWVSIQEKIGSTKMEELLALFGGYPIDPET